MLSETTKRFAVALVGIPLAVGVVFAGGWTLTALLAVLAVLSTLEVYRLSETKSVNPLTIPGVLTAIAFVGSAGAQPSAGPNDAGFGTLTVVAVLTLGALSIWQRGPTGQPLLAASVTFMGAAYVGATLSFGIFLRHIPATDGVWHGTILVFTPIAITWANDTCAYFVGRRFGRRKLIPTVSPGKTVAGAIGALVGSVLVAIGIGYLLREFPTYRMTAGEAIGFGVVVSLLAQLGDLVESLFKRDASVKDSGQLFPGHGGALDRLDSLFYTIPLGYYYFRFVVGAVSPL